MTDPATMRPKGTCFVVFASADAARACLERNNREATEDFRAKVCGRTVWVCEVMAQRDVRDVSKLRKSTWQLTKGTMSAVFCGSLSFTRSCFAWQTSAICIWPTLGASTTTRARCGAR